LPADPRPTRPGRLVKALTEQAAPAAERGLEIRPDQPANGPAPGAVIVTDKGLSGQDTEAFLAGPGLCLALIRPARRDEKARQHFPNWLRQRVEAIIWTAWASPASGGYR
jgi:hypothetical protein